VPGFFFATLVLAKVTGVRLEQVAKSGIAHVAPVSFFFDIDNSRLAIGLSSGQGRDKAAHTSQY